MRLSPDVAWRKVGGELFFITPDGMLHNVRSQAGIRVVELMAEGLDLQAAEDHILDEFDVEEVTLKADLNRFFQTLRDKGIVID